MLIPYTTPYHRFQLPVRVEDVKEIYITYSQYDEILFEKTYEDCTTVDEYTVQIHLSQEESGMFTHSEHSSSRPELQVTLVTISGERLSSNTCKINTGKVLKGESIL